MPAVAGLGPVGPIAGVSPAARITVDSRLTLALGSIAAYLQSRIGNVPAGSMFALFQKIGMTGIVKIMGSVVLAVWKLVKVWGSVVLAVWMLMGGMCGTKSGSGM